MSSSLQIYTMSHYIEAMEIRHEFVNEITRLIEEINQIFNQIDFKFYTYEDPRAFFAPDALNSLGAKIEKIKTLDPGNTTNYQINCLRAELIKGFVSAVLGQRIEELTTDISSTAPLKDEKFDDFDLEWAILDLTENRAMEGLTLIQALSDYPYILVLINQIVDEKLNLWTQEIDEDLNITKEYFESRYVALSNERLPCPTKSLEGLDVDLISAAAKLLLNNRKSQIGNPNLPELRNHSMQNLRMYYDYLRHCEGEKASEALQLACRCLAAKIDLDGLQGRQKGLHDESVYTFLTSFIPFAQSIFNPSVEDLNEYYTQERNDAFFNNFCDYNKIPEGA